MRRLRDDAVSEIVGFILTFALSAVFLIISLQSFHAAQENSDAVVTAVELKAIADRVAGRVVEAGLVASEFPNATVRLTENLPKDLNGHPYVVEATPEAIVVKAQDIGLTATATTFKLDAVAGLRVSGTAPSSAERVVITYELKPNGERAITIS